MESIAISDIISIDPQSSTQADTPCDDHAVESQLTGEIDSLWAEHAQANAARKNSAKELRAIRLRLAERLYQMKSLLCQPGRSGQWRSWLRDRRIPRSTADRLASRHAETLTANTESVPTEASTGDPVEELVRSLTPRLRRTLTRPDAAFRFISAVARALDVGCEDEQRGILVIKPAQQASEPPVEAGVAEGTPSTEPNIGAPAADATPEPAAPTPAAVQDGAPEATADMEVL